MTATTCRLLIWLAGFVSFPVGGVAGMAVAGRIDDPGAALVGGAAVGLVVGAGQALAARGRLCARRWVPATTVGSAAGLLLGAATVDYGTSLPALAAMGALTGAPVGLAQAYALGPGSARWLWAAAQPVLWAVGWTVTTLAGVDVERQYPVFGSTGALAFMLLSGLLLERVAAAQPARPGQPVVLSSPRW
jgi:hypothetical protein